MTSANIGTVTSGFEVGGTVKGLQGPSERLLFAAALLSRVTEEAAK
jgi:hypothetical protein